MGERQSKGGQESERELARVGEREWASEIGRERVGESESGRERARVRDRVRVGESESGRESERGESERPSESGLERQ